MSEEGICLFGKSGKKINDLKGSDDQEKSAMTIAPSDYTIYIAKHSYDDESACKSRCRDYAYQLKGEMKKYLAWEAADRPFSCPRNTFYFF